MEKRFTLKDLVLLIAIASVGVMLLVAMYMVDRQWVMMSRMRQVMQEQAQDLRAMRGELKALEQGIDEVASRAVAPPPLADSAGTTPSSQATAAAAGTGATPPARGAGIAAFSRAKAAASMPDFADGDWLVSAFGTGLKTITPLVSSDAYASEVQGYVMESLLARNPDSLEWQGLLAESWSVSDDGLDITFRLRDRLTFSDGAPLTADDVAFTFDFIMDEAIAAPRARAYLEKIASVTAIDPLTVEFAFREPYFNALSLAGTLSVMPRHFYEPFRQEPTTFNESKGLLMGSGPYRLADPRGWTPDQGLVELERNPRYWGPVQPGFSRLLWRVIENASARLTTFRNGEIDRYGARAREYQELKDDAALTERTWRFEFMNPIAGYSYIGWNQKRAGEKTRFTDRRVRQAMTHLIDRDRIIEEIMLGYAEPAVSPFNPRSKQHDPEVTPHPYDQERARSLLAEVGYEDRDGDGVLENEAGEPFRFELVYFQDSEDTKRIVLFLKDLFARAGVHLVPKPTEWSVMIDLLDRRDFDAITLGWTSGIETDVYQMFHSTQIEGGGDNFVHFDNPEFDRLVDEARATVDEAARMPLWQEVERIFHREQPYSFLMRRKTMAFVDRRLKNLEVTNLGLNLGFVPLEVYVPLAEQRHTD